MEAKDYIQFALDVNSLEEAEKLVTDLAGSVGGFKVGLELLTAAGSREVCDLIHSHGGSIFYDGKFKDIPATVAGATRAVATLGAKMFTVHASGGVEMMRAAVEHKGDALVLAVTVLTSMDSEESRRSYGGDAIGVVLNLALMAAEAGVDGIICSPLELAILKQRRELADMLYVVPGIRPAWAQASDQQRIMTPGEAIEADADYLVIGRPIRTPPASFNSPAEAAADIAREIEEALQIREAKRRG